MGNSTSKKQRFDSMAAVGKNNHSSLAFSEEMKQRKSTSSQQRGSSATWHIDDSHNSQSLERSRGNLSICWGSSKRRKDKASSSRDSARLFMECLSRMDPDDVAEIMKQCNFDGTGYHNKTLKGDSNEKLPDHVAFEVAIRNPRRNSCRSTAA